VLVHFTARNTSREAKELKYYATKDDRDEIVEG
jgi:hypothetical protein